MARTRVLLLLVAVFVALSGCSAFFEFNAFSSLDKASTPNPSRYQGAGGLGNLQSDLSSPSIVDALKGSPSTVTTILTNLDSEYAVTSSDPSGAGKQDQQTAAILYAQLALQTSSGDELVNNIADTVTNNPSGNLKSMLASIVPA
ncbi:MAG TPA: hypothetical protein VFI08_04190, partial [Spirochaetia bacterium]|nr:hypothetical protein [Spirochaetia bacterium]